MPGTYCCITSCRNSKRKNPELSFHRFPQDKRFRKEWIAKCRLHPETNFNRCYICSDHFSCDMFKDDMRARIMNLPSRRELKPGAVPQYKLPGVLTKTIEDTPRSRRMKLKEEREKHVAFIDEVFATFSEEKKLVNQRNIDKPASNLGASMKPPEPKQPSDSGQNSAEPVPTVVEIFLNEPVEHEKFSNTPKMNNITCTPDPLESKKVLIKPIYYEPIVHKNVLLYERRMTTRNAHNSDVEVNYKELYEDLLRKYEKVDRENAELIKKNEDLQKRVEEAGRSL